MLVRLGIREDVGRPSSVRILSLATIETWIYDQLELALEGIW